MKKEEDQHWIENDEWSSATPAIVEFVIRKLDDINETRSGFASGGFHGPRTLLGTAVTAGAPLELIRTIIESGADPNAKQETFLPTTSASEFSILHCAVARSTTEIIEYLLDNGADIDLACQNHEHALPQYTAIYSNSLDTLKLIYQRSNKSQLIDKRGNTLLHYAVASDEDRSSQVELLVEMGVDVDQKNQKGETSIASFVNNSVWIPSNEKGPHLSNLKKLVQLGGDPNSKTLEKSSGIFGATSQTPMGLLARGELDAETTLEAAKLLVSAGAEVDSLDSSGESPLNTAISNDNGLVKYLLECGADPNYRASSYSDTPFTKAVTSPFSNETVDEYIELIEIFLNAGCDPNAEIFDRSSETIAKEIILRRLEKSGCELQKLEAGSLIRALLKA